MRNRTAYNRDYAKLRRATPEGKAQNRAVSAAWRQKNYKKVMLSTVKSRALKEGLEFSITMDDLDWPVFCPILGVVLCYGGGEGKFKTDAASIDRLDSSKGYVPGNVFIMSWRANRIKNDATLDELKALVNWLDTVSR